MLTNWQLNSYVALNMLEQLTFDRLENTYSLVGAKHQLSCCFTDAVPSQLALQYVATPPIEG